MKKRLYKYGLPYIGVTLAVRADNAGLSEPAGSATSPAQVLNTTVKSLPDAAITYYDLPDDQNLKYVRVSYKVDNMVRTVNASFYTGSLIVEGFPIKGEYDIELYPASYGEVVSPPLVVKVNPDTPPYQKVCGALVPTEAFDGIRMNFDNPEKVKLGPSVIKKQAEGIWTWACMYYTEAKGGDFYTHDLDAVITDFGILVRSRWGHLSDTLYVTETPLYEEQCDKSLFRRMALSTNSYECYSWSEVTKGSDMTRLWDRVTDADPYSRTKMVTVTPQWFTFDMRENYRLSRFVMVSYYYPGKYGSTFKADYPKHSEIWGDTSPNPDGSSDDPQVLLLEYESMRPSGGGVNDALTTGGQEVVENGENFTVPDNAPAVRYTRFRTDNIWGNIRCMYPHELTFFGAERNQ